jgi:hypothetical protein
MRLSSGYEVAYRELLGRVARTPSLEPEMRMAIFWPMVGHRYDGDLMVIGRAVNGWVVDLTVEEAGDAVKAETFVRAVRENSERDEMRWVTDLAGNRDGYNTSRSAFWRVNRRLALPHDADPARQAEWSSHLVWTNLYKCAPVAGWNPGGDFLRTQTPMACRLLAREIDELEPKRIVALTGRSWFEPFADYLGLDVGWRSGLVEGVATYGRRPIVVARHPMGKPEGPFVAEVLTALEAASGHSKPPQGSDG